jgi:hypothetical protein
MDLTFLLWWLNVFTKKWEPCYDIGIFEVHKTSRVVPWLYNFATCYGHAMSLYAINDVKVCDGMKKIPSWLHNLLFKISLLGPKKKR